LFLQRNSAFFGGKQEVVLQCLNAIDKIEAVHFSVLLSIKINNACVYSVIGAERWESLEIFFEGFVSSEGPYVCC